MIFKKSVKNKKPNSWEREEWFKRWIDFPTLFIGFCWASLLLLWPNLPSQEQDSTAQYKSMVVAQDVKYSGETIYRRPDLIAVPSSVSFMPEMEEERYSLLPDKNQLHASILERQVFDIIEVVGATDVALSAEAIRNVNKDRAHASRIKNNTVSNKADDLESNNIYVYISGDIGDDAVLSWSESDYELLCKGSSRAWEVELSLEIGSNGLPKSLFLEKSSGDNAIDRGIVHALSRNDLWKNVLPGIGTVLISFSPKTNR